MDKQVIKYKGKFVCTLDDLVSSYKELNNVWKVGEKYNIAGQLVHKKLTDSGDICKMNFFTEQDYILLKEKYKSYRDKGQLIELAKIMNRTVPFISRKAKVLGLTDNLNHISMKYLSDIVSTRMKNYIKENGHPKGMLGKTHDLEFKKGASIRVKKMWQDPKSKFNSDEFRQKKSDYMSKFMAEKMKSNSINNYNRVKKGMVTIGGKTFFARSSWECNIAAYLEFLKAKKQIKDWEHETDTFWFEKIKRGVRSYLPDYKVTNNDDTIYYLEVKGQMDKKSKTKLDRMKLYYPNIKLEVIDNEVYKSIKKWKSIIKDWGLLDSDEFINSVKNCVVDGCDKKHISKSYCRMHYYQFITKTQPKKIIKKVDL